MSIDWLCGITHSKTLAVGTDDLLMLFYTLFELDKTKLNVAYNENHTSMQLSIHADENFKYNALLIDIIKSVYENICDFETYTISKDVYDIKKEKQFEYYNQPLILKSFPELNREERMKKHMDLCYAEFQKNSE